MTAEPAQNAFAIDPRSHRLASTLQIEVALREAETLEQVFFVAVNELERVVPYDTAVVWLERKGKPSIAAVTAVSEVDGQSAFAGELRAIAARLIATERSGEPVEISKESEAGLDWPESLPQRALSVPLGKAGRRLGGLLLFRAAPWQPAEQVVVEHVAGSTAFAAERFLARRRSLASLVTSRNGLIALAVVACIAVIPVRLTVLAPAEVVAVDSITLAAPYSGVVKDILTKPNANVTAGQPLFRLDDTEIRGKREIAGRELEVSIAELLAARQKAFGDQKSKTEAAVLEKRIDLKRAEIAYFLELLGRFVTTAPSDGVVLMGDPEEWKGRPVKLGEKVMTLARPSDTQLQVWLPVDDAITLAPGAQLRFFLNVDPLNPVDATLKQTAYEAEMSPNDVLSYRVRGAFSVPAGQRPRLGLKGTAKLYGDRVALGYYILRRPLAVVRRTLGL